MSFSVAVRCSNEVAQLELHGRFDFSAHREFRSGCESVLGFSAPTVEIDLAGVDYLDSSALGMLLILKDEAEAARRSIRLVNCSPTVRSVLQIARFDKLVAIR